MNDNVVKPAKKRNAIVRRRVPIMKQCEHVEIGEILLCKLRGYPEWPAFVTGKEGNMIAVEFFGDHTTYKTNIANCYKFSESSEKIVEILRTRKNPLYGKSVKEAEAVLGIPFEQSIVNRVN